MNNFEFIIEVKSKDKEALKEHMLRLKKSVDGDESLSEIKQYDLDTDWHYLGLLAIVLCGKKAVNWYEDAYRAFIDGMHITDESTELYVRVNWPEEKFIKKIIGETELSDLRIKMVVNEEDESTVDEFGEDFAIEANKQN